MTDNAPQINDTQIRDGQQPDGRYCRWFTLGATEVDLNNRLRLQALLGMFQETAGDQCEQFGSGWSTLWTQHGLCYVVVRMEVRMERYPKVMETVTVETFPAPLRRWFFPRYYIFRDEAGKQIGCAATLWVLLDLKERRMTAPGDVAKTVPDNSDLTPPMGLPSAVDLVEGPETVTARMPAYFDLDVNQHVNNTRYLDWACDALGVDRMRAYCLKSFRVSYDNEVRPDQEISLRVSLRDARCRVAGYHDGKLYFEVGAELGERDA